MVQNDDILESFLLILYLFMKQNIATSIFRQLCLENYKHINTRLSWWQCFSDWWRLASNK